MALAQALTFAVPFILTGLLHIAVIKHGWLGKLACMPLDRGASLFGRRLFGDNKTYRGGLIVICGVAFFTAIEGAWLERSRWAADLAIVDYQRVNPVAWGLLLGLGCVLGELPNSFLKRRLGIAPGTSPTGAKGVLFWICDQLDSLGGVLVAASIFSVPRVRVVVWLVFIALVVHPVGDLIMRSFGLKRSGHSSALGNVPRPPNGL